MSSKTLRMSNWQCYKTERHQVFQKKNYVIQSYHAKTLKYDREVLIKDTKYITRHQVCQYNNELRQQVCQNGNVTRQQVCQNGNKLRQQVCQNGNKLRQQVCQNGNAIRQQLCQYNNELRQQVC